MVLRQKFKKLAFDSKADDHVGCDIVMIGAQWIVPCFAISRYVCGLMSETKGKQVGLPIKSSFRDLTA